MNEQDRMIAKGVKVPDRCQDVRYLMVTNPFISIRNSVIWADINRHNAVCKECLTFFQLEFPKEGE